RNNIELFVLLLLVIALILINGCAVTISTPTPQPVTQSAGKSKECFLSKDCETGFHCFNKKCVSNEILKNKEDCVVINQPPVYRTYCTQKCENCKDGNFTCWGGSTAIPGIRNKCVECTKDRDCKPGFVCDEYRCVR
ncbi:hypothetical protein DRJ17_06210, partial [Candidatus Woesearchaeota archaeon]